MQKNTVKFDPLKDSLVKRINFNPEEKLFKYCVNTKTQTEIIKDEVDYILVPLEVYDHILRFYNNNILKKL